LGGRTPGGNTAFQEEIISLLNQGRRLPLAKVFLKVRCVAGFSAARKNRANPATRRAGLCKLQEIEATPADPSWASGSGGFFKGYYFFIEIETG
jgi:hypothetical protein